MCFIPKLSNPWRPLSAPNARRLHPSELFSKPMIEEEFPLPSPLLRFPGKPLDLPSALQRLTPISPAVPLLATQSINPGRGRLLSWVFSPLGLLPPLILIVGHLHPQSPLSFLVLECLSTRQSRNLRVSLSEAWLSPHSWGAGPSGVSHPLSHATCSKSKLTADYFFISIPGTPLRKSRPVSLCSKPNLY